MGYGIWDAGCGVGGKCGENAGSTVENAGSAVENAGSTVEKLVLILKIECYVMNKANV